MTQRAQEEAFFYRLNLELIQRMQESRALMCLPIHQNAQDLYDILNKHLQPNEHWHNDICF